jgi:hypothetical protein
MLKFVKVLHLAIVRRLAKVGCPCFSLSRENLRHHPHHPNYSEGHVNNNNETGKKGQHIQSSSVRLSATLYI